MNIVSLTKKKYLMVPKADSYQLCPQSNKPCKYHTLQGSNTCLFDILDVFF